MHEFRRPDLSGNLPALTGLRAIAALWVLVYHAWVEAGPRAMGVTLGGTTIRLTELFSVGWAGVDIFFTLSAFLLTLPFVLANEGERRPPTLGVYFKRRALRILPAYYAQFVLMLVLAAALGWWVVPDATAIAAHLVLWFNLGSPRVAPLLGVWWTLPIEFAFYFLLPMFARTLRPGRVPWLVIGAIAATVGYRVTMFLLVRDLPIGERVLALEQLPGRLDQFVIGMASAYLAVRLLRSGRAPSTGAAALLTVAGALGLIGLAYWIGAVFMDYWDGHPLLFCWHLLASICVGAMILGCVFGGPWVQRVFANRFVWWTGTVSYSVYLWHQVLIQQINRTLFAGFEGYVFPWLLLAGLAATMAVASVSYLIVERPFLRVGRERAEQG